MQQGFEQLEYVIGTPETVGRIGEAMPLRPFDDGVLAFLNDLSSELRGARRWPDVATFAFWCRKGSLMLERARYDDLEERLGRGVVFHSTPSNVAMNFAYSFAAGLLAGNANVVRLPARDFDQVGIVGDAVRRLLDGRHSHLSPYVAFVRFPPSRRVADYLSSLCDVRVVWGGDATVSELRQSPLPPRATEITFADRHSIAVIDADAYIASDRRDAVAQGFYNDTYYTDQNACTSPRIVFWRGERKVEAKADFWERVHRLAMRDYRMTAVQAVGKLDALYSVAAARDVRLVEAEDMLVTRVEVDGADAGLMSHKYHSGFWFECDIRELSEIAGVCDTRCQTLTYFGVGRDELRAFVDACRPHGLDRCVPVGKSMDFSLVWDGYDLIRQMSRRVTVI